MNSLINITRSNHARLRFVAAIFALALFALASAPAFAQSATPTPNATPSPTPTPGATPTPSPTPGATPSPTPTPGTGPVEIEADLSGATLNGLTPKGEAEFEIEANGDREFKVRVENINLPAGTVLNVLMDNALVGTITLNGTARSELVLKSENGQTVPQINSRTRVVVANQAGATIVAGSFSNIAPTPNPNPNPTPNPSTGEIRIESRLAGAAIGGLVPKGHARYRLRDGRRKLNVEVEKVNLPAGTVLSVFVDNVKVGEIVLRPTLENELELDTNKGQNVPQLTTISTVTVTNAQGATILSGVFNTAGLAINGKDIDNRQFFVEQHYRDFFDREADDSGLSFWTNEIARCGDDAACIEGARVNTSGAFFLSIEFEQTGYLLYRFNKASFGTMPRRNEFLVDMQAIAQGVVVNSFGWEDKLEANKRAAAERWVARAEFTNRFGHLSNDQYVNALFNNAGIAPTAAEREALIAGLNANTESRATVLRKVAENPAFAVKERNAAFVLMQYFGYLHRNPDEGPNSDLSGFNFWLGKLNEFGGDFHRAEMVRAFINASEYRERFDW